MSKPDIAAACAAGSPVGRGGRAPFPEDTDERLHFLDYPSERS